MVRIVFTVFTMNCNGLDMNNRETPRFSALMQCGKELIDGFSLYLSIKPSWFATSLSSFHMFFGYGFLRATMLESH